MSRKHHINPHTGVAVPCPQCQHCELAHYSTKKEAQRHLEEERANALSTLDPRLTRALAPAVASGYVRGARGSELREHQLNLLFHPGVSEIAASIAMHQHLPGLSWLMNHLSGTDSALPTMEAMGPALADGVKNTNPSEESALALSQALWERVGSPLHEHARTVLLAMEFNPNGYRPGSPVTVKHHRTAEVAPALGVNVDKLPTDIIAYDIETDTSSGSGLRPMRTQLTDVVLATAESIWTISGDEIEVLGVFSELTGNIGLPMVGWNNWIFDDIALQTRAEHHEIPWGYNLVPRENYSDFEPASPSGVVLALANAVPTAVGIVADEGCRCVGGVVPERHLGAPVSDPGGSQTTVGRQGHGEPQKGPQALPAGNAEGSAAMSSIDLFQLKLAADRCYGTRTGGLKDYAEALGCSPVRVDRSAMHALSPVEAEQYAVSDGLMTLRVAGELL